MKKNGFIFVETIVAIVILTSSLLLIYASFSNILQGEKTRVYYDDVSYLYRSEHLRDQINDLNIRTLTQKLENMDNKYFLTIGMDTEALFLNYENSSQIFDNMLNDFEVKQIILLKENKLDNLKKCTLECSEDKNCQEYENCNDLFLNLSDGFISYLKAMYVDITAPYVLAVEYETCGQDNQNCQSYYSWVSV